MENPAKELFLLSFTASFFCWVLIDVFLSIYQEHPVHRKTVSASAKIMRKIEQNFLDKFSYKNQYSISTSTNLIFEYQSFQ